MTSARVIQNYYVTAGLYTLAAALIWGVNTLFLLDAGLDIFGVFIANAAFTLGSVLLKFQLVLLRTHAGGAFHFSLASPFLSPQRWLMSPLPIMAAG